MNEKTNEIRDGEDLKKLGKFLSVDVDDHTVVHDLSLINPVKAILELQNDDDYFEYVKTASTEEKIICVGLQAIRTLIIKNREYGNSALSPLRIYSYNEQPNDMGSRIDEKLARIRKTRQDPSDRRYRMNDIADMVGYNMLISIDEVFLDWRSLID